MWTNLSAVDAQYHGISDQIARKRYVEASKLAFQRKKLSQSLTNPPQLAARTANVSVEIDGYRFGTARPVDGWENGLYVDVQATLWSGYRNVISSNH
jgi:hypothetical protein